MNAIYLYMTLCDVNGNDKYQPYLCDFETFFFYVFIFIYFLFDNILTQVK